MIHLMLGAFVLMATGGSVAAAQAVSIETIRRINRPGESGNPYAELENDIPAAIRAIKSGLIDSDVHLQTEALRLAEDPKFASDSYLPEFETLSKSSDQKIKSALITTLGRYPKKGGAILKVIYEDKGNSNAVRASALNFLCAQKSPADSLQLALHAAVSDAALEVRSVAARIIAADKPEVALQVARQGVFGSKGSINQDSLWVLERHGTDEDLRNLKALRDDPETSQANRLFVRDTVRRLSINLVPTPKAQAQRLKEISAGADKAEGFWAVSELLSRDDEFAAEAVRAIANDKTHPFSRRVRTQVGMK